MKGNIGVNTSTIIDIRKKGRKLNAYLKSKDAVRVSEFIDIYSSGTIRCINCSNEKTYESLDEIYEV